MNTKFFEMARDCLYFARDALTYSDYQNFCRQSIGPGVAYYDRIRVFERLVRDGLIRFDEGRLNLGVLSAHDWLDKGLVNGEADAWELISYFSKRSMKFDPDDHALTQIGLAGEYEVMRLLRGYLRADLHPQIVHVSLTDDSAGFDIFSPSVAKVNQGMLLEVKTTARPGNRMRFYLTENEVSIARKNSNWRLLMMQIVDGTPLLVGWIGISEIDDLLPKNVSSQAHWTVAKLELERESFEPGLP